MSNGPPAKSRRWRDGGNRGLYLIDLSLGYLIIEPGPFNSSTAILTGVSSKSYWHLSRSKATQVGMTNDWLKAQGLASIRDLWMKAHGYEVPSGYA